MKRIPIYLFGLLLMAACGNSKLHKADSDDADDTEAIEKSESSSKALKYQNVSYTSPDSMVMFSAEVPVKCGTPLTDSIMDYVAHVINYDFDKYFAANHDAKEAIQKAGKACDAQFKEEIAEMKRENGSEVEDDDYSFMWAWELQEAVTKAAETDRFVTFLNEGYQYMGGAHGINWSAGTTFDKKTGKRIGLSILKDTESLKFKRMFNAELLTYFTSTEGETLSDYLLGVESDNVPLSNMYFVEDGIVFQYQPYEISYYAAGMPMAKFTFEQMKPYLTDEGLKLIGEEEEKED